jgi:hypothetical protein
MMKATFTGAMLAAAVLTSGWSTMLAQEADPRPAPALPPIEVSVDCEASPERVTVTNNRANPTKLKSVSSTYARRAGEPYEVKKTLKPGQGISYTFGTGKGKGKRLTGSFIFDNDAGSEGVLVKTNKGRVKVLCDDVTNAPPQPEPEVDAPAPGPASEAAAGGPVDALELLTTLPVVPEVDEGYERELFEHWVDADGDSCDTRQEVLISESLTPVTLGSGCRIEGGSWFSAADGDTLTNSASVDINHVVPLKEAWASGAHAWSPERREAFANDLSDDRTLQAVSSGANRQQGENDPASWLPVDREAACQFVADWVAIKASWDLSVDQAERDAIALTLESCPERTLTFVLRGLEEPAHAN